MAADLLLESESRHLRRPQRRRARWPRARRTPPAAISLAAFACADAFSKVTADAIQMHGGIAFTWAHPAHLYLRRARADAQLFGTPAAYRERYPRQQLGSLSMADGAATLTDDSLARRGPRLAGRQLEAAAAAKTRPAAPAGPSRRSRRPGSPRWSTRAGPSPRWPAEWYGRGLSDAQGRIVEREFAAVGAPGTGQDRTNLWANTALAYASPTLQGRRSCRSC